MNARIFAGLIALVLVVAAFTWWSLRASTSSSSVAPGIHDSGEGARHSDSVLDPSGDRDAARRTTVETSAKAASPTGPSEAHAIATKTLDVLVVDGSTHAPLPNMFVELHSKVAGEETEDFFESMAAAHKTDDHGRTSFARDVEGPVDLRAWDPDETLGSVVRTIPSLVELPEKEIVLELSPHNDLVFWMRIVDQDTHVPIAGAHITRIVPLNPVDPTHRFITDASGLFLWRQSDWNVRTLQFDVPDHSTVFVLPVTGHEVPEKALDIEVWHSATLRALVLQAGGEAAVNTRVQLTTDEYRLKRPDPTLGWDVFVAPNWMLTTDGAGRVTFPDLPANVPIAVEVQFEPAWSPGEPLTLKPGETRDVQWKTRPGCRVHGIVLDQNASAVARCDVWVMKANMPQPAYLDDSAYGKPAYTARTDAQGRFTFPAIGAGTWWIGPGRVKPGAGGVVDDVAPLAQVLVLDGTQSDVDVELRVDRGLFVRGRVEPPPGKDVGEGFVLATDGKRHLMVFQTWKKDGAFAVGPLMRGPITLEAESHSGLGSSPEVIAEAGQSDVILQLVLASSVTGRVVDEKGDPVGAQVFAARRSELGYDNRHFEEVAAGEDFEFIGLEGGHYVVGAVTTDGKIGRLEALDLPAGTSLHDQVVHVVAGGRVRVRYTGSESSGDVEILVDGVSVSSGRIARDVPAVLVAPSGRVLVRVSTFGPDPFRERTVNVDVGVTTDVVIDYGAH